MKAVLFDLDGTLIDSRRDLAEAVNVALAAVGLPARSLEEITSFVGEGSRRLVEKAVAPRLDLLEAAHRAWEAAYTETLLRHTVFYPGMRELAARLGEQLGGRVAVHTNKPGHFARPILEGLGAAGLFVRVLGGGDGPAKKPASEGASALLAALGCAPTEAVYVGDSIVDQQTAAAAGIPFLGVAWGYGEVELRATGARMASSSGELEGWLSAGA